MTIYQILITKYQRLFTNEYQISTKDYVRIYKLFMQNKANFVRVSPENADFTKKQTQFKPNLSQFKANLTQNKPNQSQFVERTKMNAFAWIRSFTIVFVIFSRYLPPLRVPISNRVSVHGHRETQITFDLAIGVSIKSYVTQKTSVTTEIMTKG